MMVYAPAPLQHTSYLESSSGELNTVKTRKKRTNL